MKKYIFFVGILFLLGLMSCEETTTWELEPGINGQLVVEAILTDELSIQQLRLSTSYDEINTDAPGVTDAQVWVEANGVRYFFLADSLDQGLYQSEVPFAVLANLDYELNIDWQGNRFNATSTLSEVAAIPTITFDRETDNLLSFDPGPFLYNANQQAMYIMELDWSHLVMDSINRAKIIFYTFNTLEESELSRPRYEEVFFPRGTIVHLRKLGLNEPFADYLRALNIETRWNGGVLYSNPASLPSNISNGALGFFSTCAVQEETFIAL